MSLSFDVRKCGPDKNHQNRDDADDDEELQKREGASRLSAEIRKSKGGSRKRGPRFLKPETGSRKGKDVARAGGKHGRDSKGKIGKEKRTNLNFEMQLSTRI